jgi:hypothetical protein
MRQIYKRQWTDLHQRNIGWTSIAMHRTGWGKMSTRGKGAIFKQARVGVLELIAICELMTVKIVDRGGPGPDEQCLEK